MEQPLNRAPVSRGRRALRGLLLAVLALLFVLAAAFAVVWIIGGRMIARTYDVPSHAPIAIPTDSASIARGRHIAIAYGSCTLCHGEDFGGAVYMDAGPMGFVAGPNLTSGRGGIASQRSDEDWIRALRYGVKQDGTSLLIMPSEVYHHLSDADLGALIAFLKQLPPVDREIEPTKFRWLGKLLTGSGQLNLLVASKVTPFLSVPSVEPGENEVYGRYLAEVTGCAGCHGYGMSGGRVAGPPDLPPASNLTPGGAISAWTEADFIRAMRTGRRPDGSEINEFMPWRQLANMTDSELRAIWNYLHTLPSKPFGLK